MMKILLLFLFMVMMIEFNLMIMFYMNLCFLISSFISLFYLVNSDNNFKLGLSFGIDKFSIYMMLLSIWIMGLMFMSLMLDLLSSFKNKAFMFSISLLILLLFFVSMNFMYMYLYFEFSLIPTFFIVLLWGNNLERLEAGFFLVMYMMLISLPLLLYIMKIYNSSFTLDLSVLTWCGLNFTTKVLSLWDFLMIFSAFFIKLPIFLFHVWLPKAHVEAPVYGSMLLAAILLKLGGYGILRLVLMFPNISSKFSMLIVSVGLMGAANVSLLCLNQVDMKSLVAYSSVVHMNFMLASLFSFMKLSFTSGLIMMISHGLCSSGLFFMVTLMYKRSLSRLIIFNKGYINIIPSLMVWWFLLCMSNFSFPFSLNFISEIMIIMVMLSWGKMLMIFILMMLSFFSGAYSLYLYSSVMQGDFLGLPSGTYMTEILCSLLHFIPLMLFLMNLMMII